MMTYIEDEQKFNEIQAHDLDFFLDSELINEKIYRRLLVIQQVDKSMFEPLEIFHWAYYFLYRVDIDRHPEAMIDSYFSEMESWDPYNDRYCSNLVFLTVRSILELQPKLSKRQDRFLEQISVVSGDWESYSTTFRKIVRELKSGNEISCEQAEELKEVKKQNTSLQKEVENLHEVIEELEKDDKPDGTLKVKCLLIETMLSSLGADIANIDQTKISRFAAYMLGVNEKRLYNRVIQPGIALGDYHEKEINKVNKMLSDLGLDLEL